MTKPGISDEGAVPVTPTELAAWVMKLWAAAIEKVIESMVSERPRVTVQMRPTAAANPPGHRWVGHTLSLAPAPAIWTGAPDDSWKALGRLTLAAFGVDEPTEDDIQSTCRDLSAQVTSAVAQSLTEALGEPIDGGDTNFRSEPDCASSSSFAVGFHVGSLSFEETAILDPAFLDLLGELARRLRSESREKPPADRSEAAEPGTPPRSAGKTPFSFPKVGLKVHIVLGRATLPLREVLKLNVGSVIELDRTVTDLADIVVHDRRIASGQIVVVHGNYGIRVTADK